MSNFDAAIDMLKFMDRESLSEEHERDNYRVAIRLLEAAGGFTADDKERIANALDNLPYYTPIAGYKCPGQVLRDKFKALLSALPEVTK